MKTTDFVRLALESSKGWALGLIHDMKDQPTAQPTDKGGNHPLWVLGHIAFGESMLLDVFILGKENRFAEFAPLFNMQTTPSPDARLYPSMDELTDRFNKMRSATLAYLDSLTDADLDQRSHAPEEFGELFRTVGGCFAAMVTHVSFHAGQVADARRAAGRPPLMA